MDVLQLSLLGVAGAWVVTDEARALRDIVFGAMTRWMARHRCGRALFADKAGLTEKQLSDQLTLKAPLNLWRLADVPGFRRDLLEELAHAEGCDVFERYRTKMILIVDRSARPMLKACLPGQVVKESA